MAPKEISIQKGQTVLLLAILRIWLSFIPDEVRHWRKGRCPIPKSFSSLVRSRCPPVSTLLVVRQENQLILDKVQLQLGPYLKKRCIFLHLAVVIGLFPGIACAAVEEETSQPRHRSINPELIWTWI